MGEGSEGSEGGGEGACGLLWVRSEGSDCLDEGGRLIRVDGIAEGSQGGIEGTDGMLRLNG